MFSILISLAGFIHQILQEIKLKFMTYQTFFSDLLAEQHELRCFYLRAKETLILLEGKNKGEFVCLLRLEQSFSWLF